MPAINVRERPGAFDSSKYNGKNQYDWFEFRTRGGHVYAVMGVTFFHEKRTAWMHWLILRPSIAAWRDLRREIVPVMREWVAKNGIDQVCVSTDDRADVQFERLVGFIGFKPLLSGETDGEWPRVAVFTLKAEGEDRV